MKGKDIMKFWSAILLVVLLAPLGASAKPKPKPDACANAYRSAQASFVRLEALCQGTEKTDAANVAAVFLHAADLIQNKPAKTAEFCTQDRLQSVGLAQAKAEARIKSLDPDKPDIDQTVRDVDRLLH
jgi:hypothetical protein